MSNTSDSKKQWVKSGFLTLLEKGSGLVFALGTAVILLRALTKEDFAAWGIFLIITYFLEMGRSGLIQNGLVRFLSTSNYSSAEYSAISTASFFLNFCFSIVSNIILLAATQWICTKFHAPQLYHVLPVYFLTNFVMAFFYHFNFVQQANFEFRGIFWSTFFFRGSLFFWVLICWFLGWPIDLRQMAFSMLAGAVLGAAASWIFSQKHLSHARHLDFQWIAKLTAFGKYVLGTNLSTMFYKNIDKLTLGSVLGPAAFAIYDAAAKITAMVEVPSFSIAAVVFPQSAKRMETEGKSGIKWLYERSVGAILAIILPFVVLSLIFAEPIVWVFAGEKYMDSANVLRLTAFFGLFLPFAVQFGTILDSTGKPAVNFWYTFLTAVLNFGLSYFFVRWFGLFGAAIATLTGYSISFILMQRYLYKEFGINALNAFRQVPEIYKMGIGMVRQRFFMA